MSAGFVYMRPLRLAGVSSSGVGEDAILNCWALLNEWITRKSLAREIEIGYGLINRSEGKTVYTACVELPEIVTPAEADELARASLQGGAYLRSRFQGTVDGIDGQFEDMRADLGNSGHVRFDSERPLVTVFLDVKGIKSGQEVRSNLLIPVRGGELAESPSRAA